MITLETMPSKTQNRSNILYHWAFYWGILNIFYGYALILNMRFVFTSDVFYVFIKAIAGVSFSCYLGYRFVAVLKKMPNPFGSAIFVSILLAAISEAICVASVKAAFNGIVASILVAASATFGRLFGVVASAGRPELRQFRSAACIVIASSSMALFIVKTLTNNPNPMSHIIQVTMNIAGGVHGSLGALVSSGFIVGVVFAMFVRGKSVHIRDQYDLFISYKSINVVLARQIAEQMIHSGIKVWFAEYEILTKKHLEILHATDEERNAIITQAIDDGINKSKYGLALTNNCYASSQYCQHEIKQLLLACGSEHIVEIMIPKEHKTHELFKELTASKSMIYNGNINDILKFAAVNISHKIKPIPQNINQSSGSCLYKGECRGRTYSIDTTGWDYDDSKMAPFFTPAQRGSDLIRKVEEGILKMNMFHGEEINPQLLESHLRQDTDDDRDAYNLLISYAEKHMEDLNAVPRGVHLFFHGGHSQICLTYQLPQMWMRKYSIILTDDMSDFASEFVFTFIALGMDFSSFCRNAHLFDKLVLTLKWDVTNVAKIHQETVETALHIASLTYDFHYKEALKNASGSHHQLELIEVSDNSPFVNLIYRWKDNISYEEADNLDTRLRAYIACAIYDVAISAGMSCRSGPIHGNRPSWIIDKQTLPVSLIDAGFNYAHKDCNLTIGPIISRDQVECNAWSKDFSDCFKTNLSHLIV
jgi:hypothetical protein